MHYAIALQIRLLKLGQISTWCINNTYTMYNVAVQKLELFSFLMQLCLNNYNIFYVIYYIYYSVLFATAILKYYYYCRGRKRTDPCDNNAQRKYMTKMAFRRVHINRMAKPLVSLWSVYFNLISLQRNNNIYNYTSVLRQNKTLDVHKNTYVYVIKFQNQME